MGYIFFFFKQKTAYEMRISDWSSDVCSSDLGRGKECTRRMALVVLGEQQMAVLRLVAGFMPAQLANEQVLLEQLLAQPHRHCHPEGREAARGEGESGRASRRERVGQNG